MIRDENEYKEAVARLGEERARLTEHARQLKEAGLGKDEIKRVTIQWNRFTFSSRRKWRATS